MVDQEIEVHQATMKLGIVLLAAVWVPLVAGKYWNEYDAKFLNQFDDRTFTGKICDVIWENLALGGTKRTGSDQTPRVLRGV